MARGSIQTREWLKQLTYVHFERVTLLCIMFLVGVIAVYAMILATIDLVSDIWVSHSFLEKEALQDTFGHILTIVILLEFNHSIYVALTERAGAIQTRIVVLIGVLVVARKLMLQDFVTLDVQALLGLADCSWRSEDSIGFSLTRTAGVRSPRRKSNVRAPRPGSPAAPDGTHHRTPESPDANRHPAAARAVAKGFVSFDIAAPPEDVATCCIDPW